MSEGQNGNGQNGHDGPNAHVVFGAGAVAYIRETFDADRMAREVFTPISAALFAECDGFQPGDRITVKVERGDSIRAELADLIKSGEVFNTPT